MAVPWLRWLVADLSPRRPGFDICVVDKVAFEAVCLRGLPPPRVRIIPPALHTHTHTSSTRCSYQKNTCAKPGNFPKNNAFSEVVGKG